ncbi:porin [Burkholderia aenigmatica]|uniref:porin n=1 Tax=Burkholderia aenigmatica TaxID=2015348 RepID=UPI0026541AEC|nr:porin [Burkholderia aenigmatica]MDN7875063.1 porin [Burkholderia aenigmatica]
MADRVDRAPQPSVAEAGVRPGNPPGPMSINSGPAAVLLVLFGNPPRLLISTGVNFSMKRFVQLLLMSIPGLAMAQSSVTLYGLVDTGIQYLTNADSAGHRSIGMAPSAYLPSRFGFRGVEDLGGGVKAVFQLENGFNSATGSMVVANTLFNRQAWVGVDGSVGKLTFGRQYSVQFDRAIYYDPTFFAAYSALSLNAIPLATIRVNNSAKFTSSRFAGFTTEAMYGFGQQEPGNALAGRYIGAALEYTVNRFTATATYEQARGTVTEMGDLSSRVDNRYAFAARYNAAKFAVMANVTRVTGDLQLTPRGTVYWLAGNAFVTPFLQLYAIGGRYDYQGCDAHPMIFVAGTLYSLSKRTMLYANVGTARNNGGSSLGLNNYASVGQPGHSQLGVAVGIDQKF